MLIWLHFIVAHWPVWNVTISAIYCRNSATWHLTGRIANIGLYPHVVLFHIWICMSEINAGAIFLGTVKLIPYPLTLTVRSVTKLTFDSLVSHLRLDSARRLWNGLEGCLHVEVGLLNGPDILKCWCAINHVKEKKKKKKNLSREQIRFFSSECEPLPS